MSEEALPKILDDGPKLIATISFAALMLSAIHEWGYFQVIGLHYLTVASPLDYLSSALIWLPAALALAIAFFVLNISTHRAWKNPKRISSAYFWIVISLFGVALANRLFTMREGIIIIICLMLGFTILYVFGAKERSLRVNTYLSLGALIILLAYVLGLNEARRDLDPGGFSLFYHELRPHVLSLRTKPGERKIYVLRNFEKGILVKDIDTSLIGFYPWQEITTISEAGKRPAYQSIICKMFERLCV